MNAAEFFNSDAVNLPLCRMVNDDFEGFVKGKLDQYLHLIEKLKPSDDITLALQKDYKSIKQLCGLIEVAIREYHSGLPHKAYMRFHEGIESAWHRLKHLILADVQEHPQLNELYRIRVAAAEEWHDEKKHLFHVPFEERHKVKRQRYSIPGLPCLYLGGTLYVCWEEMDRPNFDSVFMARFKVAEREKIRILDLGGRPKALVSELVWRAEKASISNRVKDFCLASAMCWPLAAACSIKRAFPKAPFVSEYIVPQLLLQWVIDSRFRVDGISYFSVKLDSICDPPTGTANFVFPARSFSAKGTCKWLRRVFAMSEPVSWQILENNPISAEPLAKPVNSEMTVELVRNHKTRYGASQFGKMEEQLLKLPCSRLP